MVHHSRFDAAETRTRTGHVVVALVETPSPGGHQVLSTVVPIAQAGDGPRFVDIADFDPATHTALSLADAQAIAAERTAASVADASRRGQRRARPRA